MGSPIEIAVSSSPTTAMRCGFSGSTVLPYLCVSTFLPASSLNIFAAAFFVFWKRSASSASIASGVSSRGTSGSKSALLFCGASALSLPQPRAPTEKRERSVKKASIHVARREFLSTLPLLPLLLPRVRDAVRRARTRIFENLGIDAEYLSKHFLRQHFLR